MRNSPQRKVAAKPGQRPAWRGALCAAGDRAASGSLTRVCSRPRRMRSCATAPPCHRVAATAPTPAAVPPPPPHWHHPPAHATTPATESASGCDPAIQRREDRVKSIHARTTCRDRWRRRARQLGGARHRRAGRRAPRSTAHRPHGSRPSDTPPSPRRVVGRRPVFEHPRRPTAVAGGGRGARRARARIRRARRARGPRGAGDRRAHAHRVHRDPRVPRASADDRSPHHRPSRADRRRLGHVSRVPRDRGRGARLVRAVVRPRARVPRRGGGAGASGRRRLPARHG